jgi:hypothetical protein
VNGDNSVAIICGAQIVLCRRVVLVLSIVIPSSLMSGMQLFSCKSVIMIGVAKTENKTDYKLRRLRRFNFEVTCMSPTTEQYSLRDSLRSAPENESVTDHIIMVAVIVTALVACIAIGIAVSGSTPHISTRMVGTGPDYYDRPASVELAATRAPVSPYLPLGNSRLNQTLEQIQTEAR